MALFENYNLKVIFVQNGLKNSIQGISVMFVFEYNNIIPYSIISLKVCSLRLIPPLHSPITIP